MAFRVIGDITPIGGVTCTALEQPLALVGSEIAWGIFKASVATQVELASRMELAALHAIDDIPALAPLMIRLAATKVYTPVR